MSKDYEEPISEESSKTRRTVGNGAKHLQVSRDLVVVLCIREAVRLSGKGAGFVIRWSRVKSSIQLLTGFVLGFPKFNFCQLRFSSTFSYVYLKCLFLSPSHYKALRGLQ